MTASDKASSRDQSVLATADTQALAEAFCTWPLPASVCSDSCATMPGYPNRSGTNLITVAEAKAMFDHLVERGLLTMAIQYRPISELRDGTIGPVVFWNSCNGPFYKLLVLAEDAQEWREEEIFTHFVLLETDPEERNALSASAPAVPVADAGRVDGASSHRSIDWWDARILRSVDPSEPKTSKEIGASALVQETMTARGKSSHVAHLMERFERYGFVRATNMDRPILWIRTEEGTAALARCGTATVPPEAEAEAPAKPFAAGDRVRWHNPPLCEGTVLKNNGGRCKVQWDTGEVRRDTPDKLRLADTAPAPTGKEARS